MPVLTDPERQESFAEAMRTAPPGVVFNVNKLQLKSLHDAVDTVMDSTFPSINTAIQAEDPTWNTLNNTTKKWLFAYLVNQRFRKGVS